MIRGWPRSTAGQLAAVIAVTTLAAQVISAGLWLTAGRRIERGPGPDPQSRIALIARVCGTADADSCDAVIAAADDADMGARRVTALPPGSRHADASVAGARLLSVIGSTGRALFRVAGAPAGHEWVAFPAGPVRPDLDAGPIGFVLFDLPARGARLPDLLLMPLLPLLLLGAPVAVLSLWAVRRIVAPITRLSAAAAAVAPDALAEPVRETGTEELRSLARAYNAMLARLRQTIADRTRMMAAIGHDLRTPLTRLRLRADGIADPALHDAIVRDLDTMTAMVTTALDYLATGSAREAPALIDAAALLQTICDTFEDGGAAIRFEGPAHLTALCQPRALERALNNVIENALRHAPSATVTLRPGARDMLLDVDDDGPGIPDADKPRVLRYFARGDTPGAGYGLGLAIAHTVAEAHGGTLTLIDRVPHGLRVRFALPLRTG